MGLFKKKVKEEPVKSLKAFVSGKVISITEVNDQVFSSKALGGGVAIQPAGQIITAPCDGVVSMIAEDSYHAVGMTLNNGAELLLHIGLDTVSMNGDGFESKVKQGQMVRKGEELLLIDLKKIADAGHPATVITVVTNTHEFAEVRQAAVGNVEAGATLLKVGK